MSMALANPRRHPKPFSIALQQTIKELPEACFVAADYRVICSRQHFSLSLVVSVKKIDTLVFSVSRKFLRSNAATCCRSRIIQDAGESQQRERHAMFGESLTIKGILLAP